MYLALEEVLGGSCSVNLSVLSMGGVCGRVIIFQYILSTRAWELRGRRGEGFLLNHVYPTRRSLFLPMLSHGGWWAPAQLRWGQTSPVMFCQKYLPSSFSIYNLESSEVLHSQGVILDLQCLSSVGVIFCIFIIFNLNLYTSTLPHVCFDIYFT